MEILNDFNTSVRKALEEIDPNYESYPGLVVCGTHNPHDMEELMLRIKEARKDGTPYLGICFGHQLAWIEYCRSVLGISDATSEEFGQGTFVVKKRPEMKVGLHEGESYWSNYYCVDTGNWEKGDGFITVPYHPEYQSSKDNPHPILKKFIELCKK